MFLREKIFLENFHTRKFPDLRYLPEQCLTVEPQILTRIIVRYIEVSTTQGYKGHVQLQYSR